MRVFHFSISFSHYQPKPSLWNPDNRLFEKDDVKRFIVDRYCTLSFSSLTKRFALDSYPFTRVLYVFFLFFLFSLDSIWLSFVAEEWFFFSANLNCRKKGNFSSFEEAWSTRFFFSSECYCNSVSGWIILYYSFEYRSSVYSTDK